MIVVFFPHFRMKCPKIMLFTITDLILRFTLNNLKLQNIQQFFIIFQNNYDNHSTVFCYHCTPERLYKV